MCKVGNAGFIRLTSCSLLLSSGPDARHHGRYGPEGQLRGVADHRIPQLFVDKVMQVVGFPGRRGAEAVSLGLGFSAETIEIHQLLFDLVADVPVVLVGRVPQVQVVIKNIVLIPVMSTCPFLGQGS